MREGDDFSDDEDDQVVEEVKENPLVVKQRSSGSSGNEDFTGEVEGITQKPMQTEMAPLIKQSTEPKSPRVYKGMNSEESEHSGSNSSGRKH